MTSKKKLSSYNSIDSHALKQKLNNNENFILMDVREPEEFEICHIDGAILVPLSEINDHLEDFDYTRHYVVYCKKGDRSLEAINLMSQVGFNNLYNLDGGVIEWAKDIEPTMELY